MINNECKWVVTFLFNRSLMRHFIPFQLFFGTDPVYCEVLTPHAVKAVTPPRHISGVVDVYFGYKNTPLSSAKGNQSRFMYTPGKQR